VSESRDGRIKGATHAARAFWSGTEGVAAPLAALVMTAGLVRALGPQEYGVLVIALAISALSLAINPAIAATTTKFVAEAAANERIDRYGAARHVTASLLAVSGISVLYLALTGAFAGPLAGLLFGKEEYLRRPEVAGVLLLAVLSVCIQQMDGVIAAGIKGLEKFKQQAIFELCSRSAVAGAAIGIGFLTHRIAGILLTMCAVLALSTCLRAALLRSLTPGRRIFARPSGPEVRRFISFGGWMWLNGTATVAYGTVDRVIVGRFLGTAAAAQFHIYIQLTQLIHYIPANVFAFAFPMFSRLSVGGPAEGAALKRTYGRLFAVIVAFAVAAGTVLLVLRHPILGLFSGRGLGPINEPALLLLIGSFALLALNIAPYYLLLGLGDSKPVSLILSLSVAVAIALALILVPRLGIEGAALARFGYVLGTLTLLVRAHKRLRMSEVT
jgi:O-antigen/teichoic acid export membrane protein